MRQWMLVLAIDSKKTRGRQKEPLGGVAQARLTCTRVIDGSAREEGTAYELLAGAESLTEAVADALEERLLSERRVAPSRRLALEKTVGRQVGLHIASLYGRERRE
jgi:hypothetical protein